MGNLVRLTRDRLAILQRDHPEATADRLWTVIMRPDEIAEHSDRVDRLVYRRKALPTGESLLVFTQEEAARRFRIVTAFAPDGEGYYARTTGRRLWP